MPEPHPEYLLKERSPALWLAIRLNVDVELLSGTARVQACSTEGPVAGLALDQVHGKVSDLLETRPCGRFNPLIY